MSKRPKSREERTLDTLDRAKRFPRMSDKPRPPVAIPYALALELIGHARELRQITKHNAGMERDELRALESDIAQAEQLVNLAS